MPILVPEQPPFVNDSEALVRDLLRDQLGPDDLLVTGMRFSTRHGDLEADVVVAFADGGVVTVEIKGSRVWCEDGSWWIERRGRAERIDPVGQARRCQYALRDFVSKDPRWGSRANVRWAHAVVLAYTTVDDDFAMPDAARWQVAGKDDLPGLAGFLKALVVDQDTDKRLLDVDDVLAIAEILQGRGLPQKDLVGTAAENEDIADRLTQEQAVILGAIRELNRVEIRGGAGTGKTWLAVEQARRLTKAGERVALTCYSRGLAAWMERRVATFPRREQPAYVGTFHGLGKQWGAEPGSDTDSDYWERRLPEEMVLLGRTQPPGQMYDALVIDEAQDFADAWWPAALAALRDDEGGLYVFSDEGQRVFSRFGGVPAGLVPLVLDQNLRNTRQIAATFSSLAPIRMKIGELDGPEVELVECLGSEALATADDQVDRLIDAGWAPGDIAVLATGSRHPEQSERQAEGQDAYWASFWDAEQVFYGHVLGFKGLERRVVVLAVNDEVARDRASERLYVGLSRARDQLVVCGDPAHIEEVGGAAVLRKLRAG